MKKTVVGVDLVSTRSIIFIGLICLLTGCISNQTIYNNYRDLHTANGVDMRSAKTIAQRKLINTDDKGSYRLSMPDIKTGPIADKYPGYWFVVFGHNWFFPMSQNALGLTYTQLRETEYLVVINKKTGEVLFYGQWYPKRENDFDWVFDRRAYKKKDLLALPPGEQSSVGDEHAQPGQP